MISDKATKLIEEMLEEAEDNSSAALIGWDKSDDKLKLLKSYIAELESRKESEFGVQYEVFRDGVCLCYGLDTLDAAKEYGQQLQGQLRTAKVEIIKVAGFRSRTPIPFEVDNG